MEESHPPQRQTGNLVAQDQVSQFGERRDISNLCYSFLEGSPVKFGGSSAGRETEDRCRRVMAVLLNGSDCMGSF